MPLRFAQIFVLIVLLYATLYGGLENILTFPKYKVPPPPHPTDHYPTFSFVDCIRF